MFKCEYGVAPQQKKAMKMLRILKHEGTFRPERGKKYFYNEAGKTLT